LLYEQDVFRSSDAAAVALEEMRVDTRRVQLGRDAPQAHRIIAAALSACNARGISKLQVLFALAYYFLNCLHNRDFEILLFITEFFQLAEIFFETLWVNDPIVSFTTVEAAQPSGDRPSGSNFRMHELITGNLRGVQCELRLNSRNRRKNKNKD
jgi:hypothetical protein